MYDNKQFSQISKMVELNIIDVHEARRLLKVDDWLAELSANSAPAAQQGVGQKLGTTVSTSVDSRPLDGNAGQSDPPPASAYRSPAS